MANSRKSALKAPAIDRRAVGRRLRALRGFDMNQAAFARDLGISQAQLSRYEKGKSEMGSEVLLRISLKFGKSMEWVLTGEEK
jgi:transcriptional regulator with XRE-family HTH domain